MSGDTRATGWGPLSPIGEALRFMTVLPTPGLGPHSAAGMASAPTAFGVVGWIVGALGACVGALAAGWIAPTTGPWAVLLAGFLVTRGFHLDGVADVGDALFSSRDQERMREILRDSRIGTMGALALLFVLGGQALALNELGPRLWLGALIAPPLGRWVGVLSMRRFAELGGSSLGVSVAATGRSAQTQLVVGATVLLPLLVLVGPTETLVIVGVVLLVAELAGRVLERAFGGLSGDAYGTQTELAQLTALMTLVALG